MEKEKKNFSNQKAKAPLADEKQQLTPEEQNQNATGNKNEPGKLPNDDLGTDHNSDPIIAKNQ